MNIILPFIDFGGLFYSYEGPYEPDTADKKARFWSLGLILLISGLDEAINSVLSFDLQCCCFSSQGFDMWSMNIYCVAIINHGGVNAGK